MRNLYLAIMKAYATGAGIRLTPAEVEMLAMDDAIQQVARSFLTAEEIEKGLGWDRWAAIDPRRAARPSVSDDERHNGDVTGLAPAQGKTK